MGNGEKEKVGVMFDWQQASGVLSTSTWDAPLHSAEVEVNNLSALLSPLTLPEVESPDLSVISPRAVALKIPRSTPKVTSFTFPEAPAWAHAQPPVPGTKPQAGKTISLEAIASKEETSPKRPTITRIKPPGDVIKLEDRLYYVLQPPLDAAIRLLAEGRENDQARAAAQSAVNALRAQNADGIILGCTEIPPLVNPAPDLLSPLEHLAEAAVERSIG